MNNKYRLNYLETMNNANEYLDMLEDNMATIYHQLKDDPKQLENTLMQMKNDHETILHLEDMLNMFLENNDYQMVCNQLVINEMFHMLVRDVLPDGDLGEISDYLESISEKMLIEDVTRLIDKYNN